MNYLSSFRTLSRAKQFALFLVGMVFAWSVGLPAFLNTASADALTLVDDTLTDSAPAYPSDHAIDFTSSSTLTAGQKIRVTLDPAGQAFNLSALATSSSDITATGMTLGADVGSCAGAPNIYANRIDTTSDYVELVVCGGETVTAGAKEINFLNSHVINPSATSSYVVRIELRTAADAVIQDADTRVAIVQITTVTASVDTNFTFTITGVASSTFVNGVETSTTTVSNPFLIGFGTLSVGTSSIAAQRLSVSTNALNGFVVTLEEDQELTSSIGATIDNFIDGANTAVPVVWQSPAATMGNTDTYGHLGITSNDSDLNGGEFTSAGGRKYAGDILTPRQVFSHTLPSNGLVQDTGFATVAYRVEISALQEAAKDYTNRIIYVATPTF